MSLQKYIQEELDTEKKLSDDAFRLDEFKKFVANFFVELRKKIAIEQKNQENTEEEKIDMFQMAIEKICGWAFESVEQTSITGIQELPTKEKIKFFKTYLVENQVASICLAECMLQVPSNTMNERGRQCCQELRETKNSHGERPFNTVLAATIAAAMVVKPEEKEKIKQSFAYSITNPYFVSAITWTLGWKTNTARSLKEAKLLLQTDKADKDEDVLRTTEKILKALEMRTLELSGQTNAWWRSAAAKKVIENKMCVLGELKSKFQIDKSNETSDVDHEQKDNKFLQKSHDEIREDFIKWRHENMEALKARSNSLSSSIFGPTKTEKLIAAAGIALDAGEIELTEAQNRKRNQLRGV